MRCRSPTNLNIASPTVGASRTGLLLHMEVDSTGQAAAFNSVTSSSAATSERTTHNHTPFSGSALKATPFVEHRDCACLPAFSPSCADVTSSTITSLARHQHHPRSSLLGHHGHGNNHGGIPVGAIQIESSHVQPFNDFVNEIPEIGMRGNEDEEENDDDDIDAKQKTKKRRRKGKIAFRGVKPFFGPPTFEQASTSRGRGGRGKQSLVHLPPSVATALDDGDPRLLEFLSEHQGVYHPGIRRHREDARNLSRSALIGDYVLPKPLPRDYDNEASSFTYAELFAGIGGFRLGLDAIGGKCAYANEIDPYACSAYRRNFSRNGHDADSLLEGDILDLCPERDGMPTVDVLSGGFPCQAFSRRGEQGALRDDRGHLYRELVRVLRATRPMSFIFENVKGLVTLEGGYVNKGGEEMKAGAVMQRILDEFEACGYKVSWNILDAKYWVPQRRKRLFIVGIRDDIDAQFSWDWYDEFKTNGSTDDRVLSDILEPPHEVDTCLSSSQFDAMKRLRGDRSITTKYVMEEADGTKRDVPRFLTPRECARLQGFPEWYAVPLAPDSDHEHAHFYKGIGNAVVPPLIMRLGSELISCLGEHIRSTSSGGGIKHGGKRVNSQLTMH
ncbi:hypothetical protein THAOC_11838 [Thalassiosira oceanica]|uniref:Cytosine-specific methyltransferase n=1 Tax=Thalassiosira oceanica TaxID=159749 RepID=K0SQB7_THAOC|nr:hypothetical protein THAOC_11838 [Thalassiosira oceanica]|eukprot:EJK67164.1 hypothetical protein THAOC_11838 [Thalassiosira oceanica]